MSRFCIHGLGLAGCATAWHLWQRGVDFRIIDHGHGGSSRIAAGLVQPVTGKNATVSADYDATYEEAQAFYRSIEKILNIPLWTPLESVRLIPISAEKKLLPKFLEGPAAEYVTAELANHQWSGHRAILLRCSARLDVPDFVNASRTFFHTHGLMDTPTGEAILCEGAAGLLRDSPVRWPQRCAKGEILTVHAPSWKQHRLISAGPWLVPIGHDHYKVGATYDWDEANEIPTPEGKNWLENAARLLGGDDFTITAHDAGIRPIVRKSLPIIGRHPSTGAIVFNAMGSKGSLTAPPCARKLVDFLLDHKPIESHLSAATYFANIAPS